MDDITIHIFTSKCEICALIKKALQGKNYRISCSEGQVITEKMIEDFAGKLDCVIIDKEISESFRIKIKETFPDNYIICLPSLKPDTIAGGNVIFMSEPLKLSELKQAVANISEKLKLRQRNG